MKLTQETRELLRKELPWLPGLIPEQVGEFKVEIIDLDTMALTPPGEHHRFGWYVPMWRIQKVLLIDGEGKVIGRVGSMPDHRPGDGHWTWKWPFFVEGPPKPYDQQFFETVEMALKRITGSVNTTRYILRTADGVTTLHRLPKQPKDLTLRQWLDQKHAEAQVEIARQLGE